MVYCGRPSRACRQCRNRNIKCDKKKDTCGQCRRAQLKCPGYHNPANLVFRDETPNILQKIFRDESSGRRIPDAIWEPLEDRAKYLFISRHVLGDSPVLLYMKFFYNTAPPQIEYFVATLKAVSLAYLANEVQSAEIRLDARKRYSSALRLTQESLQDPRVAGQNLTLLVVLLLDLFENLTSDSRQARSHMSSHLEGAIALAKFRGYQRFRDRLSKAIFMHLGSSILSDCLKRKADVPVDFLGLHSEIGKYTDLCDPEWQVSELMIRLAKFQSASQQGTIMESESVLESQLIRKEVETVSLSLVSGILPVNPDDTSIRNIARLKKDVRFLKRLLGDAPELVTSAMMK